MLLKQDKGIACALSFDIYYTHDDVTQSFPSFSFTSDASSCGRFGLTLGCSTVDLMLKLLVRNCLSWRSRVMKTDSSLG